MFDVEYRLATPGAVPLAEVLSLRRRTFGHLALSSLRQMNGLNVSPTAAESRSSDIRVGVINTPAVQQQYGRNFGVSVIPYRPALPVFTSSLGPRR